MKVVFDSKLAIEKFAMGSNEGLRQHVKVESRVTSGDRFVDNTFEFEFDIHWSSANIFHHLVQLGRRKHFFLSGVGTVQSNIIAGGMNKSEGANRCHAHTHVRIFDPRLNLLDTTSL